MNSKIVCTIVFIFFCTLQLGYAIECYRCGESVASCIDPETFECNQMYANETNLYLNKYFQDVNINSISNSFSCMQQDIKFSLYGNVMYKGCVFSHMNSCGYTFRPYYQQGSAKFRCYQTNSTDGNNPADRKSLSSAAMVLPLVPVLLYKHFV